MFGSDTVDGVLKAFGKILDRLDGIVAKHTELQAHHEQQITIHETAYEASGHEIERAKRVRGRIAEIVA